MTFCQTCKHSLQHHVTLCIVGFMELYFSKYFIQGTILMGVTGVKHSLFHLRLQAVPT